MVKKLEDYVADCAAAGWGGIKPAMHGKRDAFQNFLEALRKDYDLYRQADTLLHSYDENILQRDHIGKWTKRLLEAALTAARGDWPA
jgi:hypothetical protein